MDTPGRLDIEATTELDTAVLDTMVMDTMVLDTGVLDNNLTKKFIYEL